MKVLGPVWRAAKRALGHRRSLRLAQMSERLVTGGLVRREARRRAVLQPDGAAADTLSPV